MTGNVHQKLSCHVRIMHLAIAINCPTPTQLHTSLLYIRSTYDRQRP